MTNVACVINLSNKLVVLTYTI